MEQEIILKEILHALKLHSEEMDRKFDAMNSKMDERFNQMDKRFDRLEKR